MHDMHPLVYEFSMMRSSSYSVFGVCLNSTRNYRGRNHETAQLYSIASRLIYPAECTMNIPSVYIHAYKHTASLQPATGEDTRQVRH